MGIISKTAAHFEVQRILREKGFFLYKPKNHLRLQIVKVDNRVVSPVNQEVLLPLVVEVYRRDAEKNSLEDIVAEVFELEPDTFRVYLEMTLDTFDGTFQKDTATTTNLFFKNGVFIVTADEITKIEYRDLTGYVWSRQIIDHELDLQTIESVKEGKFYDFIDALCYFAIDGYHEDQVYHLSTLIGSLLNNYNNECIPEDQISNRVVFVSNTTYGCSIHEEIVHLSLIIGAITKILPTAFFKAYQFEDPDGVVHIVSDSTRLLVFSDVTEWNPDHLHAILDKCPNVKICILSCVPFKDLGIKQFSVFPSPKAAAWPRLYIDLGMGMDKLEVDRFYSAMLYMAQLYLARGIVDSMDTNCEGIISLYEEAGMEFIDYMESEIHPKIDCSYIQLLEDYNYGGDQDETIDLETFKRWVRDYAKVYKISIVETKTIGDESFRFE